MIFPGPPVEAQPPEAGAQFVVLGDHHAAVAPGAEVLAGKEGQGADRPEPAGGLPVAVDAPARADGLGPVLDHEEAVLAGHREDRLHGGHLAEQVYHDEAPGPGRDGGFDRLGRHVERIGVDVGKPRRAARVVDRAGGGEEGEGRRDDFIAGLQVHGLEGKQERIGPGGAGDSLPRLTEAGDLLFELADFGAHDEALALDDGHHGGEDGVLDAAVLGDEVEQGNGQGTVSRVRSGSVSGLRWPIIHYRQGRNTRPEPAIGKLHSAIGHLAVTPNSAET